MANGTNIYDVELHYVTRNDYDTTPVDTDVLLCNVAHLDAYDNLLEYSNNYSPVTDFRQMLEVKIEEIGIVLPDGIDALPLLTAVTVYLKLTDGTIITVTGIHLNEGVVYGNAFIDVIKDISLIAERELNLLVVPHTYINYAPGKPYSAVLSDVYGGFNWKLPQWFPTKRSHYIWDSTNVSDRIWMERPCTAMLDLNDYFNGIEQALTAKGYYKNKNTSLVQLNVQQIGAVSTSQPWPLRLWISCANRNSISASNSAWQDLQNMVEAVIANNTTVSGQSVWDDSDNATGTQWEDHPAELIPNRVMNTIYKKLTTYTDTDTKQLDFHSRGWLNGIMTESVLLWNSQGWDYTDVKMNNLSTLLDMPDGGLFIDYDSFSNSILHTVDSVEGSLQISPQNSNGKYVVQVNIGKDFLFDRTSAVCDMSIANRDAFLFPGLTSNSPLIDYFKTFLGRTESKSGGGMDDYMTMFARNLYNCWIAGNAKCEVWVVDEGSGTAGDSAPAQILLGSVNLVANQETNIKCVFDTTTAVIPAGFNVNGALKVDIRFNYGYSGPAMWIPYFANRQATFFDNSGTDGQSPTDSQANYVRTINDMFWMTLIQPSLVPFKVRCTVTGLTDDTIATNGYLDNQFKITDMYDVLSYYKTSFGIDFRLNGGLNTPALSLWQTAMKFHFYGSLDGTKRGFPCYLSKSNSNPNITLLDLIQTLKQFGLIVYYKDNKINIYTRVYNWSGTMPTFIAFDNVNNDNSNRWIKIGAGYTQDLKCITPWSGSEWKQRNNFDDNQEAVTITPSPDNDKIFDNSFSAQASDTLFVALWDGTALVEGISNIQVISGYDGTNLTWQTIPMVGDGLTDVDIMNYQKPLLPPLVNMRDIADTYISAGEKAYDDMREVAKEVQPMWFWSSYTRRFNVTVYSKEYVEFIAYSFSGGGVKIFCNSIEKVDVDGNIIYSYNIDVCGIPNSVTDTQVRDTFYSLFPNQKGVVKELTI